MQLFGQRTNPKKGRIGPKEVLNYLLLICVGTKSINFGMVYLRVDRIFSGQNVTVAAFTEKSSKHIVTVEKKIKKLFTKWNSPRIVTRVITGAGEEFVKNVTRSLHEYGIWHPLNKEVSKTVNTHNNKFGGSITLVSSIAQGGHALPYFDQLRCIVESGINMVYRIGLLIIPTDKQSQNITGGIVATLRKIPIFDTVIVWSNKRATEFLPTEALDTLAATGLAILLNRNSYRQKGVSAFDLQEEICERGNSGRTTFLGMSGAVRENPRVLRKPLFGILKRQEKYRDQTINAITSLVKTVLSDPNADLCGLPAVPDSPIYITITGYVNLQEELIPAIKHWENNPDVHILFLPSRPKDSEGNEKIIAVGFRKVKSPDYTEEQEAQFEKHLSRYLKLAGLTLEQFTKLWQRKSYEDEFEPSGSVIVNNFGGSGFELQK